MKMLKNLILILFVISSNYINAQFEEKFYYPKKEWLTIDIPYTEDFITVENDSINTLFFKPKTNPKATVLFFHGAGGNISTYMYIIKPLIENNYQVFAVDYRGYGKSTGKSTHLNIAKDMEIVFNKMKENTSIKNSKLIVYGASLGCQIATLITNNHQKEVDALILDSGFASFADVAMLYAPKKAHLPIKKFLGDIYPSKKVITTIKNIPKLIIHGKNDKSIPLAQSELVFKNAQEPKLFFNSNKGHLYALKLETEEVFKQIDQLLTLQ